VRARDVCHTCSVGALALPPASSASTKQVLPSLLASDQRHSCNCLIDEGDAFCHHGFAAKSSKTSIYGIQWPRQVYFAKLKALYKTYKSHVIELITRVISKVLIPAADKATNLDGYSYYSCFELAGGPEKAQPPTEYLASIPISFPLIGLHSSFSISSPST